MHWTSQPGMMETASRMRMWVAAAVGAKVSGQEVCWQPRATRRALSLRCWVLVLSTEVEVMTLPRTFAMGSQAKVPRLHSVFHSAARASRQNAASSP